LRAYVQTLRLADFVGGLLGAIVAVLGHGLAYGGWLPSLAFAATLPVTWFLAVALAGGHETKFAGVGAEEFRRVVLAGLVLVAGVATLAYLAGVTFGRGYYGLALPVSFLTSIVTRAVLRLRLRSRRLAGDCVHRVLAVGPEAAVVDLVERTRREPESGLFVVGACLLEDGARSLALTRAQVPVVGTPRNLVAALDQVGADTVAVTASEQLSGEALRRLAWQLEGRGVELVVSPGLVEIAGPRLHVRPFSGLPLLHLEQPEFRGARRVVKALADRVLAAGGLLVLAPLLVGIAIAVRVTTPGPALFLQTRVGRDGRTFRLVKFRSMHVNAETMIEQLRALNEKDGVLFKMREDPRVTRVGRILRRYSLDELPQLLNVLTGSMSLVGPRPPLPREVAEYGDDVRRRLLVKPGLTGLWQVSGRSDLSWEESVRLDLRYVENWSLSLDAAILLRTVRAVTKGSGAY
jgi:exopolysaccharide biosynthesis polyprenyl glycosylphosphotransferase